MKSTKRKNEGGRKKEREGERKKEKAKFCEFYMGKFFRNIPILYKFEFSKLKNERK